jgi:hypothetical protein
VSADTVTMSVLGAERGVIVTWFFRILILLALIGTLVYDASAVVANYFGLDSTASDIAVELSGEIRSGSLSPARVTERERASWPAQPTPGSWERGSTPEDGFMFA